MAAEKSPDDLTTLSELDETDLLQALKTRYKQDKIYTYVGDILIAVNPFKDLPLYNKDVSKRYMFNSKRSSQPPHIYALAELAYQSMLGRRGLLPADQCILISGESGAGKTESTKFLLRQLMELCNGNSQLEQQILQVNPLLEAFGNAQTVMNDNSSRFGKYIQLDFHKGQVLGAKISEYLLEKSRLVQQEDNEENFHVFYYMFAGKSKQYLDQLNLMPGKSYRYLAKGISAENAKMSKLKYSELVNALELVGFTDKEQSDMFTILAAILHLGEVVFTADQSEAAEIKEQGSCEAIAVACSLLGIDEVEVSKCLTSSLTVTSGAYVERNYTVQQADDVRDAMAKALYGRLFGWIVNKVNQLVGSKAHVPINELQRIGVLDIFGFEHFEHNSFEQACINLANEQLQLFFNKFVFKQEQEEYQKEGIDWTEVKFADNKHLLELFLDKPIGILSLLDEECFFPAGSDRSFVDKLNTNFGHLEVYKKSKHSSNLFSICHYAGKVSYDGCNWLEKNRDTFPAGLCTALQASKNKLIKHVFGARITRTGSLAFQSKRTSRKLSAKRPALNTGKRKVTVSGQFRQSLQILMEKMEAANPIFVRCLKPNQRKIPDQFDSQYMLAQLLYTGMLETIKIRRDGFAVRVLFEEFVQKYKQLLASPDLPGTAQSCQNILSASGLSGAHVGKTKVFLKGHHVDKLTEKMLHLERAAVRIQSVARGHAGRKIAKQRREEAKARERELAELCRQVEELGVTLSRQQEDLCQMDRDAAEVKRQLSPPQKMPSPLPSPHLSIMSPEKKDVFVYPAVNKSLRSPNFVNTDSLSSFNSSIGSEAVAHDSGDSFSDDDFSAPQEYDDNDMYSSQPATVYEWFKETQTRYLLQMSGDFPDWFHGIISRRVAETMLNKKGVIGCFLLRVSQAKFGYCLSFKAEDRCRHYMVEQLYNNKYLINGEAKAHSSLTSLVKYYQQNKISNWSGYLTVACGQESSEKDYEDLIDHQIISVILQDLTRRRKESLTPRSESLTPTSESLTPRSESLTAKSDMSEDELGYMVPQPGLRSSYLTLVDSASDSDLEPDIPPPTPCRPIDLMGRTLSSSQLEDIPPPVPGRPIKFKAAALPVLPGEMPRSSRLTPEAPNSPRLTHQVPRSPRLTPEAPRSPRLTQQASRSPRLTPEAPNSPRLTHQVPRSPRLTPEAPRSPRLTQQASRSPRLTQKTALSPRLSPEVPRSPRLNQAPRSPKLSANHSRASAALSRILERPKPHS